MRETKLSKKKKQESSAKVMRLLPSTKKDDSPTTTSPITSRDSVSTKHFPIVGIGASAGGLAAFEAFFSGMPAFTDSGMAFVLVQHLAPDHKSILTGLIQRYTRMLVSEVEDGMEVQPNCAYIIPPGRDMAFLNGSLQLFEPSAPRGQRLPIDFFFRSLAQDQRERAICIVLSGTGSDGTLGLRAIKGEGGMAMAQIPGSTEYEGMPRNAIATGLVDYVLPPAEMPAQLMAYVAQAFGNAARLSPVRGARTENIREKIFILLRAQTGHDFSQYKANTVNRRIERRMAVHQINTIEAYAKYLQETPAEVESLFRDLLIGVTNFFRDPETFKALEEQIIPKLFAGTPAGTAIRVWTPGCSTGEEAYSLAILMQEHLNTLRQSYLVQIFATDIDRLAIATARAGLYPASIAADITPERLARNFTADPDGHAYRIDKNIRDMLVFSEQDMIKDPPFSKLDLISCRNLLIYLGADLQKEIIPLFHYALKPGGFLFLGTSETVGDFKNLFNVMDRKAKLYQRNLDVHSPPRGTRSRHFSPMTPGDMGLPLLGGKKKVPGKLSLRELTERGLLQQVAPTGALVNDHGDILYLHGRVGMYLGPAPGEAGVNNILKMAREGLSHQLASTLRNAVTSQEIARYSGLRVETNGADAVINLTVRPVITGPSTAPESHLYLVVLEEIEPVDADQKADSVGMADNPELEASVYIASLKQELRAKEEYLQTANEELETSNEELKSSNEEMQSINEELSTVNGELQSKLVDLTQANNDMNNLLAGTGIATVFVDQDLHILRFTPTATRIINLIQGDIGRPVGHIVSNLVGYDRLSADVQSVFKTLDAKEMDVQTEDGKWYTMRILPYRTLGNVVEGAVINFVDISEEMKTRAALQKALDDLQTLRGILPICSHCKNIRDDEGYWTQMEKYIQDRSAAQFSHGICPSCMKELYPELDMDDGFKGGEAKNETPRKSSRTKN